KWRAGQATGRTRTLVATACASRCAENSTDSDSPFPKLPNIIRTRYLSWIRMDYDRTVGTNSTVWMTSRSLGNATRCRNSVPTTPEVAFTSGAVYAFTATMTHLASTARTN